MVRQQTLTLLSEGSTPPSSTRGRKVFVIDFSMRP